MAPGARRQTRFLACERHRNPPERFGQSSVSRAIGQLRDKGIISERQRKGTLLIHPLLAGYESLAHMTNHLKAPDTHLWPINFPTGDIRPPRVRDVRAGTDFDPDPDGGEDAPAPEARPSLRLAG
ncbi:hypothetical protein [Streptomyces sp. NPDC001652]|uniref:hypothetical protein n=1 Tax=Streptomyces sp. NPDC001652 TaxID=3154393 RepID=UPI003328D920